jgi:hypothetical protein
MIIGGLIENNAHAASYDALARANVQFHSGGIVLTHTAPLLRADQPALSPSYVAARAATISFRGDASSLKAEAGA